MKSTRKAYGEFLEEIGKDEDVVVFDADLVLSGGEDYALIRAFYEWKTSFKHRIVADSPVLTGILPLMLEIDKEWQQQEIGYRLVIKALLLKLLAMLYRCSENRVSIMAMAGARRT